MLAKDQAQLEGAQRDVRRYSELIGKGATTQVNLDNAKTTADILMRNHQGRPGRARQSEGPEELHHDPRAVLGPGRCGQRQGRQFRAAGRSRAARRHQPDGAGLRDVRRSPARAGRSARVDGEGGVRGDRDDPGPSALGKRQGRDGREHGGCHHRHGHRARHHEQRERDVVAGHPGRDQADDPQRRCVVVPTVAVQRSQSGNFVFVVKDGAAKVQPVTVDRTSQGMSVISEGLAGDESVVVDGQLLLSDGTRVEPRTKKAGA